MISTERNFLLIHVPKTGGSSVQKVLLPYSDSKMVIYHPEGTAFEDVELFDIHQMGNGIVHKHASLTRMRTIFGPEVIDPLFKAMLVRNPWDRVISFLHSPHWRPTERLLTEEGFLDFIHADFVFPLEHYADLDDIDFFLRFEHLEADFQTFCEKIDVTGLTLPHLLKGNHGAYQNYYTDRTREAVATRFAQEIERFGYAFEPTIATSAEMPVPTSVSCPAHP